VTKPSQDKKTTNQGKYKDAVPISML